MSLDKDEPEFIERKFERKTALSNATLIIGGAGISCNVVDISPGGAKIKADAELDTGKSVILKIDHFGDFPADIVWQRNNFHGLAFHGDPEKISEILMAMATYG